MFLPDGEAREVSVSNAPIVVVEGPLTSSLSLQLMNLQHNLRIKNSPGKIY